MKTLAKLLILAVAALGLFSSCSDSGSSDETNAAFTHPPVGVLKAGDYEVILHTGPDGPLYTVANETGEMIAQEIDRAQLAAEFPELNEELSGLWAGNDAGAVNAAPELSR